MAEMSKIEEVARAIEPNAFRLFENMRDYCLRSGDGEAEALSTAEWAHGKDVERAKEKARAAIEAMQEPTANMSMKGLVQSERDDINLTPEEVDDIWGAMIDAALSEEVAG